jgi:hypothetical protein
MARLELGDDTQLVEDLKDAGFTDFFLGIESLNSNVLSDYNKKLDANLQTKRVRAFSEKGLAVHGAFIFGVEGQTTNDVLYAAKWAADTQISYGFFVCYMEYPYQNRLYGSEQLFPDWRIIQTSPAYQNYCYVGIYPTFMRPSKLQKSFIEGYKIFLENRLDDMDKSYRMTKIKIWHRNLKPVIDGMKKYAHYLESIEAPYYNSNDELLKDNLENDYHKWVKNDPLHFEHMKVIVK